MHFCSKEAIQKEIHHQGYFHLHEMKLEEGKGCKASMLPLIQVTFPIDWVSLTCKILETNWWSLPTIFCSVFKTILIFCGVYKHRETREYRIHAVKCANLQTWWRGMYFEVRCYQKQIHCVERLIKMNLNLLFGNKSTISKQEYYRLKVDWNIVKILDAPGRAKCFLVGAQWSKDPNRRARANPAQASVPLDISDSGFYMSLWTFSKKT